MFCLEILSLLHIINNRTQTNLPVVSLSGYEPRQNLCIESTFRTTGNTLPHSVQRNDSLWCLLESHWKCTCFMWLCKDSVWKGNCSKPIHTETTEGSCGLVVAAGWIWLAACTLHWRTCHSNAWERDGWSPQIKWGTMPRQTPKSVLTWLSTAQGWHHFIFKFQHVCPFLFLTTNVSCSYRWTLQ